MGTMMNHNFAMHPEAENQLFKLGGMLIVMGSVVIVGLTMVAGFAYPDEPVRKDESRIGVSFRERVGLMSGPSASVIDCRGYRRQLKVFPAGCYMEIEP